MNKPNTPELIQIFAENGYLIDQAALSYVKAHDYKELLYLIQDNEPELIVVNLEVIRRVKRVERKNVITRYIREFKPKPRFKIPLSPGFEVLKRLFNE